MHEKNEIQCWLIDILTKFEKTRVLNQCEGLRKSPKNYFNLDDLDLYDIMLERRVQGINVLIL